MTSLTSPPPTKLLEKGLETLRYQCEEWSSMLEFERDELAFLFDLMRKRKLDPKKVDRIEEELIKLTTGELDELRNMISKVRSMIDAALDGGASDEGRIRKQHDRTAVRVATFQQRLNALKRDLFKLALDARGRSQEDNAVIKAIHLRRAVRRYKSKAVDPALVDRIIDAGRMAPSALNRQSWQFHVVADTARIRALSKEIRDAAEALLPLAHGIMPTAKDDIIFHKAPVVIFLSAPKKDEWATLDIGMCAQNMMLAATSLGLASCPIGFARFVMATRLYPTLKVSASREVKLALAIGYGDEAPAVHERVRNNVFRIA